MDKENKPTDLEDQALISEFIRLVGEIASLNFPSRINTNTGDTSLGVLAAGLNMLSEEVEKKMVELSNLKEVNHNLENFSLTLAHDIKSPLNNIMGIIDLMDSEVEEGSYANIPEYIELIRAMNSKSLEIVSGILEYSKSTVNSRKLKLISIQKTCAQIVESFSRAHSIRVTYQTMVPEIYYDPMALYQVLSNLINNAIKFNNKQECALLVKSIERQDDIMISIQDNGPGIPEKFRDNIFNLFFRLNQENQPTGTGLGLAIIKKIILENNGKIWTESRPGEGTTFCFTVQKAPG
ncbi:HAMP domain-containing histidine kinase [Echinicola soli]|uniref:histidine kinase n=1 Tax=Echinicola soli TaxID=2591634 RepID=A0A514CN50_9BACT|nr:HAMP domain-containing sensor histidine kinase [Echinicola soli]QDH81231.1 HAMP domain-containing histidine kinase [Echinicola soli]